MLRPTWMTAALAAVTIGLGCGGDGSEPDPLAQADGGGENADGGGDGASDGGSHDAGSMPDGMLLDGGGRDAGIGSDAANDAGADTGPVVPSSCDMSWPSEDGPLRRLSRDQYLNTIYTLVADYTSPEEADGFFQWGVGELVERLPPDERRGRLGDLRGGFTSADQVVHQEHVDVQLEMAVQVANAIAREWMLDGLVEDCDPRQDTCTRSFVERFGARVWRRPLTATEVDQLMVVFAAGTASYEPTGEEWDLEVFARSQGYRDTISVMLASPEFVYQIELGEASAPDVPDTYVLSAFEVASRLAFHFWREAPDAELLAAAADGSLMTPEGFDAQVDRLFADPRTERSIQRFTEEWLRLEELPEMDRLVETALYESFADGLEVHRDLREAMIHDTTSAASWFIRREPGTLDDLFRSNLSFAEDDTLAAIYGTGRWDGSSRPQEMPDPERAGLLTRAAMTASGSANTRPVVKGVRIREAVLCAQIDPPPDNAAAFPPPLSPELTTREVVESITEVPGSDCAGCHVNLINPYGFATENFDALGRAREHQRLFNEWGEEIAAPPVDTATTVLTSTAVAEVADAHDLADALLESGDVHRCFARQYADFALGRPADGPAELCVVESLEAQLLGGATLDQVFRDIVYHPAFQRRTIVEVTP